MISAAIGLVAVALAVLQFANPYILHFRSLKILVYSWTMLLPFLVEVFSKSYFEDSIFYVLIFLFPFFISLIIQFLYNKFGFKFGIASVIGAIIYSVACVIKLN